MERQELHDNLLKICENVYYQPPSLSLIKYPHIKYSKDDIDDRNALNSRYLRIESWNLLVVSHDIEDAIVDRILEEFPMSRFVDQNLIDGLYQTIIILKTL